MQMESSLKLFLLRLSEIKNGNQRFYIQHTQLRINKQTRIFLYFWHLFYQIYSGNEALNVNIINISKLFLLLN